MKFWKLSGAGNDFVLVNELKGRSGSALAKILCDRRLGVGADGLLLLTRKARSVRLDYWNSDGSSAFCGNGSRAGVYWAVKQGWLKGRAFDVETNRGVLHARVTGKDRVRVSMPAPKGLRLGLNVKTRAGVIHAHFVDTGVPHAVIFVDDVSKVDVNGLGPELRRHKIFGKAGANVNFVELEKEKLTVRTFERGVEAETLACGTGVVASAFVARVLGFDRHPVRVTVRGGDTLSATFQDGPGLEGPAEITFTGEVPA